MDEAKGPPQFFHGVFGTPDEENCPICKAHPPETMGSPSEVEGILVQEIDLSQILGCPCPMCREARQEDSEAA